MKNRLNGKSLKDAAERRKEMAAYMKLSLEERRLLLREKERLNPVARSPPPLIRPGGSACADGETFILSGRTWRSIRMIRISLAAARRASTSLCHWYS